MYPQITQSPDFLNFLLQQRLKQGQNQPTLPNTGMYGQRQEAQMPTVQRGMFGQDAEPREEATTLPEPTPNRVPAMLAPQQVPSQPQNLAQQRLSYGTGTAPPSTGGFAPTGQQQQQITAQSPTYTPMPEYQRSHQHGEKMGFGQRILHALKAGGLGFMRGGVGGAAAGLIGGGVDPEFWHRAQYQYQTLPMWQQRFAAESALADQQRQDTTAQAQILNQQNIAGDRQERIDLTRERNKQLAEQAVQTDKEQAAAATTKLQGDLAGQRERLTKESGQYAPGLGQMMYDKNLTNRGNVIPALDNKGFYRMPSPQQQDARKLTQTQNESRARNAASFELYLKKLPFEEASDERKAAFRQSLQGENDRIDLEGVPTITQFEALKSEAEEKGALADKIPNNDEKSHPAKVRLRNEADAALGRLAAMHSAMLKSGGYKDNSGGGSLGIERLPRTKKGGVTGSTKTSGKTDKDITQDEYEHLVKVTFKGDEAAAKDAMRRGKYTVGGKAIE